MEQWKIYKITGNGPTRWGHRIYEVSDQGNVKINGNIIEPKLHSNGYLVCAHFFIHRAVAELFIPNTENKPFVDHINTNKLDNRAENLRWVTRKENANNPLTIKHNSEGQLGRVAWNKGKITPIEVRKKQSESRKIYLQRKRESKLNSL